MRAAKPVGYMPGQMTNVRELRHLHAAGRDIEGDRFGGIVWNAERSDLRVIHGERYARRHGHDARSIQLVILDVKRLNRSPCRKNLNRQILHDGFPVQGAPAPRKPEGMPDRGRHRPH